MGSHPQNPEILNYPKNYRLCKPWHPFNHTILHRCTQKVCMQIKSYTSSPEGCSTCADPESLLFCEGREDPNTTINGPSSARQPNAI